MCDETVIVICAMFGILLLGAIAVCLMMYNHIKKRDEADNKQMFSIKVLLTELIDIFDEGQEGKKDDRINGRRRTDG